MKKGKKKGYVCSEFDECVVTHLKFRLLGFVLKAISSLLCAFVIGYLV